MFVGQGEPVELVRIRDKEVEGGSRLINKENLKDTHVIVEDEPAKQKK